MTDEELVADLRGAADRYRERVAQVEVLEARVADLERRLAGAVRAAVYLHDCLDRAVALGSSIGVPSPDGRSVETPNG